MYVRRGKSCHPVTMALTNNRKFIRNPSTTHHYLKCHQQCPTSSQYINPLTNRVIESPGDAIHIHTHHRDGEEIDRLSSNHGKDHKTRIRDSPLSYDDHGYLSEDISHEHGDRDHHNHHHDPYDHEYYDPYDFDIHPIYTDRHLNYVDYDDHGYLGTS